MNVKELIEILSSIENKNLPVVYEDYEQGMIDVEVIEQTTATYDEYKGEQVIILK